MRDTSMLDELNAEERSRKATRKYYAVGVAILSVLVLVGGVSAFSNNVSNQKSKSTPSTQAEISIAAGTSTITTPVVTPEPTTTPTAMRVTPANTDMDVINAKLCKDIIEGAQESANFHRTQYFKTRKDWLNTFAYRTESAEAQEAKQFYIDHFKKQFNDLISSTNPMAQSACKSSESIAGALVIPDFNEWK